MKFIEVCYDPKTSEPCFHTEDGGRQGFIYARDFPNIIRNAASMRDPEAGVYQEALLKLIDVEASLKAGSKKPSDFPSVADKLPEVSEVNARLKRALYSQLGIGGPQ